MGPICCHRRLHTRIARLLSGFFFFSLPLLSLNEKYKQLMENVHLFHMGQSECGEEPGESFLGRTLTPADGWMPSQSGPARPGLTLLTSLRQSVTLPRWQRGDVIQLHAGLNPPGAEHGRRERVSPRPLRRPRRAEVSCAGGDGENCLELEVELGWLGWVRLG